MALELARYPDYKRVLVHSAGCRAFSTVSRDYQIEPIVQLPYEWTVQSCLACHPVYGVVIKERRRVRIKVERRIPDRFYIERQNRTARAFPPYGVMYLDIEVTDRKPQWKQHAACRTDDARLKNWIMWLWNTEHARRWPTDVQKVICSDCPVRAECLEAGVWDREPWGVWGGATEKERRQLLKLWVSEGRTDGRPQPPGRVQRQDGSWIATPGSTDGLRAKSGAGQGAESSEVLHELWPGEAMYGTSADEWSENWG